MVWDITKSNLGKRANYELYSDHSTRVQAVSPDISVKTEQASASAFRGGLDPTRLGVEPSRSMF
jgi:hypothetical protein